MLCCQITDKIWPHLNFSDLKATREVSWDFFDKITRFDGFQNSAVLIVSKESVEIPNLFDKNSSSSMTQTWTGLQIEVDLPLDVLDKIRHILQHVKFLSLVISPLDPEFALFRGHNQNYANFIAGVLSSTPKLTSLQMHICLLENLTEVWTSAAIRDHLRNLQTLEMFLLDLGGNSTKAMYRTNGPLLKRATKNTDFFVISEECAVNLQQLATALVETAPPCRLKRLWIPKFLYKSSAETGNPHAELRLRRSVLDLLRSHRGSLVEVSIPLAVWNDPGDIATVTLPQLKSLTTIVSPDDTVTFETFLLHHPKLEELHLQLDVSDYEREDVDTDIWKAIKRRCAAGGAYLKKVHLKTEDYFWTYCKEGVVHDWSFLEEMEALKDFLVEILMGLASVSWREALGIGPRVLECLPRNQLKSLSLLGIHCKGSFWRSSPEGREVEVSEEVPSESKLKLLRGFQNLKRLSFRHSVNAVDDDVIQFIFREMTALEELEVSHCERLTDAGMSGTGPEDERLSIQSLKGHFL